MENGQNAERYAKIIVSVICAFYAGATPIVFAYFRFQAAMHGVHLELNDTFLTVSYVGGIAGILGTYYELPKRGLPKLPAPKDSAGQIETHD